MKSKHHPIIVPREIFNEDTAILTEWTVTAGTAVDKGQIIVIIEFAKASVELPADISGYLYHLKHEGDDVAVGETIGYIAEVKEEISYVKPSPTEATGKFNTHILTRKAEELINKHKLTPDAFGDIDVIRSADVLYYLEKISKVGTESNGTNDERAAECDAILNDPSFKQLSQILKELRKRMKTLFNRHIPTSELLYDRWEASRKMNFGEGTSIHDLSFVYGDVVIGSNCWIGPFTTLDGNLSRLTIGNFSSIGSGTQVYTHNTIEFRLSGGKLNRYTSATAIGNCCFVSPLVIIGPGTEIGDHSFVATGSYVEGKFPSHSYISGNPATRIGRVEIRQNKVHLILEKDHDHEDR